jgi:hypothetical protein
VTVTCLQAIGGYVNSGLDITKVGQAVTALDDQTVAIGTTATNTVGILQSFQTGSTGTAYVSIGLKSQ